MRILWHSNAPFCNTGYGNQTQLFTKRIADLGHDVAISAFYGLEGGTLDWKGIKIYPKGRSPYGDDVIPSHAVTHEADIVISLVDAWVYHPEGWPPFVRWIPWFPIDSEPVPPAVTKAVAQAHDRIVFTQFALKQLADVGLQAHYVPHGIDTKAFHPIEQSVARKRLEMPDDAFLVGIVGANKGYPPRKAWVEMLVAFAQFKRKRKDALLYIHTNPDVTNGGVNMFELFEANGLRPGFDVFWPNQYRTLIGGYSDADMNDFYNAFDVHLLASAGEGFGIPVVEAQAAGCPVIVGDWTATGELCFGGWKIDKADATPMWTQLAAWQFYPHIGAIVDKLEAAYQARGNQEIRAAARAGALAYDVDTVTEKYWKPVLAKIEAGL